MPSPVYQLVARALAPMILMDSRLFSALALVAVLFGLTALLASRFCAPVARAHLVLPSSLIALFSLMVALVLLPVRFVVEPWILDTVAHQVDDGVHHGRTVLVVERTGGHTSGGCWETPGAASSPLRGMAHHRITTLMGPCLTGPDIDAILAQDPGGLVSGHRLALGR